MNEYRIRHFSWFHSSMPRQSSVPSSRAGDVFHYRWAARRCLRLLDPQFGLEHVTVECSQRPDLPGELVIDVAEYSTAEGASRVEHFQLKHGTVNPEAALTLSDLKKTLAGFAARFRAHRAEGEVPDVKKPGIFFTVVTNRPICSKLKEGVAQIASGERMAAERFVRNFQKASGLEHAQLPDFCQLLSFLDRAGNYAEQKQRLRGELASFVPGFIDGNDADLLENLVKDRVMPVSESGRSDGMIRGEDVLWTLGLNPKSGLFPVPCKVEKLFNPICREQQDEILRQVLSHPAPLIVHAAGGVGKSVVAFQLAQSLPNQSRAVIYDCFGAGSYLSMSEPRHHAREALVQIANELAAQGLCHLLIPRHGLGETDFFRDFLSRVATAVGKLREIHPEALLVLLIDAADNAAMAAKEESGRELCFVHGLLREALPEGCRLVLFARSERVEMLQPGAHVRKLPLRPFSEAETLAHLRRSHPSASAAEGRELHSLSDGNPRVQANALAGGGGTVAEILAKLGPHTTTLDDQIAGQLEAAMVQLKKDHSGTTNAQVDAICQGLANLPPLIPITVLAEAAKVSVDAVKSFVADFGFGRPLWSSDNNVQFRDEPTETWFRRRFKATAQQIKDYVVRIEPVAARSGYVARALPHMLLQSGEHEKLVELALSDGHLPTGNEIEARSVRVYRLQFAFKSALCLGRFSAAVRLAFRAGEEVAGNERETEMLGKNLDLVALLEEPNRVQQMARQQRFGGGWLGCETIYSASLLSSFTDFQGDARAFLRTAQGWLKRYFEEREKLRAKKTKRGLMDRGEVLSDEHITEYWWAHYNLFGAEGLVSCVVRWTPKDLVFRVGPVIVRRLIDANRFDEITAIARAGKKLPYLILVVAEQLIAVGKLPPREGAQETLQLLADPPKRLKAPDEPQFDKTFPSVLVSFLESCAGLGLDAPTILRALEVSVPVVEQALLHTDYQEGGRRLFLRRVALQAILANQPEPTIQDLFPKAEKQVTTSRQDDDEARDHMIKTLLPWHFVRTRLIVRRTRSGRLDLVSLRKRTGNGESWRYDRLNRLPNELNSIHFEVLAWHVKAARDDVDFFSRLALGPDAGKFWLPERLQAARIAFRLPHLLPLRDTLEEFCRAALAVVGTDGPEERSAYYVELARAVLAESKSAAAVYFARALEAISKFGDEMVARWNAVVAMANRAAAGGEVSSELAYRFIRCAEMIGDTVAREKYWDRDEALQTAVRLNTAAAFAALSRWRDRDVGWFDEQVNAVAIATVRENKAPPLATWCLSGFQGCHRSRYFAEACLRAEADPQRRGRLFERILRDFELAGTAQGLREDWKPLIEELKLPKERLEELVLPRRPESIRRDKAVNTRAWRMGEERKWRKFFLGADLFRSGEFDRLLKSAKSGPRDSETLWEALLDRVPRGREQEFLRLVAGSVEFDSYDCGNLMAYVHRNWSETVAVQREWPILLKAVGRRFPGFFASCSLRAWLHRAHSPASDSPHIRDGMVAGLCESSDLIGARGFFGFVSNSADLLAPDDARSLLEYALDRFETPHMDLATQADGPFHEGLAPEPNVSKAMAGLVWCALGSPFAETRWEAAHCVRRWSELDCVLEVDALIGWLRRGNAGAFAGDGLPFYELHAKLYLLIAFLRVAVDDARRLVRHAQVFRDIALSGPPHWLIQTTAARIALLLEQSSAGSYSVEDVGRLGDFDRSVFAPRILNGFSPRVDSPRHARGEVDLSLKFHFGMDFGDCWLRCLGEAFHLSQKQVEELVREVVVGQLGVPSSGEFVADPRRSQWTRRDRDTWLHRTSYPRADDHRFYVSYHGMHAVAAQLVTELPVVVNDHGSWMENEWDEWQRRHGLTRDDGRWLSDRRDPSPSLRRPWTHQNTDEHWLWSVQAEDFFEILVRECPMQDGICIDGRWTDCVSDRSETIHISSALVEPSTSVSLANALRHIPRTMDYRLPSYGGEQPERSAPPPFDLVGWIRNPHRDDPRLDWFDPYAKSIDYPPTEIGDTFATQLGLAVDLEKRVWMKSATGELAAQTEIWSERNESDRRSREEPYRGGRRMSCKIALLRELCATSGRHLLISVEIGRSWNRSYKPGFDEYIPDSHKIFVFSADGLLRDTTKTHRLG